MTTHHHDLQTDRLTRPVVALALLVTLAGVVALLLTEVDAVRDAVVSIDLAWHTAAVELESTAVVDVAEALAVIGSVYVTAPLRAGVAIAFAVRRRWWKLGAWVLAIGTSEVSMTALKLAYERQRPHLGLELAETHAFPSGHTTAAAVTATTLVLLLTRPGPGRRRWTVVAAITVLLMAASRVYLRVHWLSDVAMGTIVGVATGLVSVGVIATLASLVGRDGTRRRLARRPDRTRPTLGS